MFKNPFSFEGRIRRTEYGISIIINSFAYFIVAFIVGAIINSDEGLVLFYILMIPMFWFIWAQGAKRCHDIGNSGWWQLIPFYGLWMLFQDGEIGQNQYGDNPKGIQANGSQIGQIGQTHTSNPSASGSSTYQGGYSGGHNNPNQTYNSNNQRLDNNVNQGSYKDGDLYN